MVDINDLVGDQSEPPAAEIRELRKALEEVSGVDADTVLRPELGRDLNFSVVSDAFYELVRIVDHFKALPLNELPPHLAGAATAQLHGLRNHFKNIQKFSIHTAERQPTVARDRIAQDFIAAVTNVVQFVVPLIGYLGTFTKESPQTNKIVAQAETARERAKQLASEMEIIVDAARKASAEVSVTKHAQHFADEARNHGTSADRWLKVVAATAALTAVLAGYQWYLIWNSHETLTAARSAQLIFSKALAFSVIISATVWCGRVYKAYRHNEIVNRHRANALSSFEALAEGTDDPATKNAVLIQATTSIFAPQSSGFSSSETEPGGPAQLIELVRNLPATTR